MQDSRAGVDRADDKVDESGLENAAEDWSDDRNSMVTVAPAAHPTEGVAPRAATGPKPAYKRRQKPVIDLDDHIRKAQEAIKVARKQVQQARVQAKLEQRKKQRLVRKASNLNVEDLERIAVLKRGGLVASSAPEAAGETPAASAIAAQPSSASSHQEWGTP